MIDEIVNTLVGLGVPGLVLPVAMHVAGYAGGSHAHGGPGIHRARRHGCWNRGPGLFKGVL